MKQTILFSLLALSLLGAACASTTMPQGTSDSPAISRIENGLLPAIVTKGEDASMKLADRMAFHQVPGVSVAVINDGRIEWAKGYGILESGSARAVTTETLFHAASISKPVAAMAALKKVEQGRLSLEEDVNAKIVSWKLPDNEFTAKKSRDMTPITSCGSPLSRIVLPMMFG